MGLGIGYMSYRTGGLQGPYYAGLNWIAIGSLAFWPSSIKDRFITVLTIYAPILVFELFSSRSFFDKTSILSITFMAGTIFLSIISNELSLIGLKKEFFFRNELQNLINTKDKLIEIKSSEAASLKTLAKQFSPAVIEAIESKTISLNQRNRKHVAIIFIDVAGSTDRSNQLDFGDYQRALDMFFDMVIKRLLQKNITVANFMGDGLMAIANAPYSLDNFERVAFETCLEIIEDVRNLQRALREIWRNDFNIRIGLSSGYVNVGFFPNSDFGIYTAIGECVNLSARLCAAADPSSLATTKSVMMASPDILTDCEVRKGGSIGAFKGFAGHELDFFNIKPRLEVVTETEHGLCPLCKSPLSEGSDLGDCIIIKCTKCQYIDVQEKISKEVLLKKSS